MSKKKKITTDNAVENTEEKDQDLSMEETQVEIGTLSIKFPMTRDEAYQVIHRPRGQVARKLKKYMIAILEEASKKFLATKPDEDVKECKVLPKED